MDLKKFIFYMLIATGFCWLGWILVLIFLNPQESGILGFSLFYLILALAILGTMTILGFYVRRLFSKQEFTFSQVMISFRQAIWISLIVVIALHLQSKGLLNWINTILLVLGLGLIEFFFLSNQAANHQS